MGSLILSSNDPKLDKPTGNVLVHTLMYLTLKSYGKVLFNRCWSFGVACVRLLASTFSTGFCPVSS